MSTVLFAPDVATHDSGAARLWVLAMATAVRDLGHDVVIHPRNRDMASLGAQLTDEGITVLPYDAAGASEEDETGHIARFRARRIITLSQSLHADHVLAQGSDLVRYLAGSGRISDKLWAIPLDAPFRTEALARDVVNRLQSISAGAHRILVVAESQRAVIEATEPSATSRVVLLPSLGESIRRLPAVPTLAVDETADGSSRNDQAPLDIEVDLGLFDEYSLPDLNDYVQAATNRRSVPRVFVSGASASTVSNSPVWMHIPGRQLGGDAHPRGRRLGLMPLPTDTVAWDFARSYFYHRGLLPAQVGGGHGQPGDGVWHVAVSGELLAPRSSTALPAVGPDGSFSGKDPVTNRPWFPRAQHSVTSDRQLRVVVAGADFKFAGDLLTELSAQADIDLRIDLFKHNSEPQPEISRDYLEWADVVIAEFASFNALWYAENRRPGQRLIVHLHGFELLSDWIDDLRLENCDAIVVASEFYRRRALSMKGWPAELVRVIPNSVSIDDLRREKFTDARYHLGLVGYVPILKRPDRALDLLRLLREEDSRYVLHLRGHSPWNYSWEWKKSAHQDSYRAFFQAAGEDPALLAGLCFEDFGPDIGNWLRKIGWLLSPSYRETFHLAGVEGAASGAIPLVWERDGSREIFTDRWNFASTTKVAEFVLATNSDQPAFETESRRSKAFAEQYSATTVAEAWLDLIDELAAGPSVEVRNAASTDDTPSGRAQAVVGTVSDAGERALLDSVQGALLRDSYEDAMDALDAGISTTAKATGTVKQAELWVRGVAALDAQRYALFLPHRGSAGASMRSPLTVRRLGESSTVLARDGLELHTVDITPYGYTDPYEQPVMIPADDVQTDQAVCVLTLPGPIRSDRWVRSMSARVAAQVTSAGADGVIIRGPWWAALIAGLAADALGLPFTWVITDPADVRRAYNAESDPFGADQISQLVLTVLQRADALVDETSELSGSRLASTARITSAPRAVPPAPKSTGTGGYPGIPRAIERTLSEVRALVAGSSDFVASWSETGIHVSELTPENFKNPVGPDIDLVVIDGAQFRDRAWAPLLTGKTESATTHAGKLFDSARMVGARSLVTAHGTTSWPEATLGTLRKADVLTVQDRGLIERVLALNPVSVTMTRLVPTGEMPWADSPSAFLRGIGIAVPPGQAPAPPPADGAQQELPSPEPTTTPESVPDLEGISVIMATHRAGDRIRGMLDSIAQQTLPSRLIELIVVENGAEPEVEEQVAEFATRSGVETHYRYRAEPGAGPARNAGLDLASREYVTFIDDDDTLEPNFLLSMWLTAAPNAVVLATLSDVHPDGRIVTNTATTTRMHTLEGGRLPLYRRAGSLGLNACKLIPSAVAETIRYPDGLHSGEDIVFMSQLLGRDLEFVPAAPMQEAAYLRGLRDNSISRRDPTFEFAIKERISVISALEKQKDHVHTKSDLNAVAHLQKAQLGFIRRYREANPTENLRVDIAIVEAGVDHVVPVQDLASAKAALLIGEQGTGAPDHAGSSGGTDVV